MWPTPVPSPALPMVPQVTSEVILKHRVRHQPRASPGEVPKTNKPEPRVEVIRMEMKLVCGGIDLGFTKRLQ